MKFKLTHSDLGTKWEAGNGTETHFSSNERFETPQKAVSAIRKHIVRGDDKLEKDLVKSLKEHGLDEKGATPKPVKTVAKKAAAPVKTVTKAAPKSAKSAPRATL
jgi:hypothetical protein